MARSVCVVVFVAVSLACVVPSAAGQVEPVSSSPFGVVCPWAGIREAGIKWCRVGAGATAFVNWPDIEKSPGVWDWSAADNELRHVADPLGLSLLPIFGYTPRWASRKPGDAEFQFHPPKDDKQYVLERSGKSWPSWQTVSLDRYLAGPRETSVPVYAKIHGTDCQVREVMLETEAEGGLRPVQWKTYQKSPSELIVYDARPELAIGMHSLDAEAVSLVRKLGLRFVRHTMYWYLMENTSTPGKYDEKQLAVWDSLVRRCQDQGIILVVVVHGNAPGVNWTNREEGYKRFARFMGDMARRYPQVRYWELWNEMDGGFTDLFGAGRADVSMRERGKLYAKMLQAAYPQIRKANPDAWVLVGGMSDWNEFPRGIYEGGGRDAFDIMALHTYGVPLEWSFSARGLQLRRVMEEFGDAGRPLWNTEFGIDAGNFVGAWGYPHAHEPPEKDADFFDREQQRQWQACLDANRGLGLYAKLLPYQFAAGNERDDDHQIRQRAQLAAGMTIDDYGFGIVRRDGRTPRPVCEWLLREQINRVIRSEAACEADIRFRPPKNRVPVGYDYSRQGDELIIRRVKIDSACPTRIQLREGGPR